MIGRVLLIGHEASRSGAPRMLLRVMDALSDETEFEVLLRTGGSLAAEFSRRAPTHVLAPPVDENEGFGARWFRRLVERPWLQPRQVRRFVAARRGQVALIHNNTVTNGRILPALHGLGCRIVTHVHETDASIRRFATVEGWRRTLELSDHFVAVSTCVRDDLVNLHGVPAERITIVPNFLLRLPPLPAAHARKRLREQLGLPPGARIVAACGNLDASKGPDLFVELAARLRASAVNDLEFLWLGRAAAELPVAQREVRWLGDFLTPDALFAGSDVVVVTSRVESFSLVALEAAALQRPVVAFAGARGPAEVLRQDHDLLAPALDVAAMAERVKALLDDPPRAQAVGERLRTRVAEEFLANRRAPELLQVWRKVVDGTD